MRRRIECRPHARRRLASGSAASPHFRPVCPQNSATETLQDFYFLTGKLRFKVGTVLKPVLPALRNRLKALLIAPSYYRDVRLTRITPCIYWPLDLLEVCFFIVRVARLIWPCDYDYRCGDCEHRSSLHIRIWKSGGRRNRFYQSRITISWAYRYPDAPAAPCRGSQVLRTTVSPAWYRGTPHCPWTVVVWWVLGRSILMPPFHPPFPSRLQPFVCPPSSGSMPASCPATTPSLLLCSLHVW